MENKVTQYIFSNLGVPKFEKYLDLSSMRHKLISGNIANASTPGYTSKDISFQEEYEKVSGQQSHLAGTITNEGHIPTGAHAAKAPKINEQKIKDEDMNSVDIDKEIPNMAQNELLFSVGATLLQRRFEGIRKVIQSR